MAGTPMVIMWPNADGSITLSQRQASGHVQPTVVSAPPRTASTVASLSAGAAASNPKLAFSIPANSDTQQSLIWAFASAKPSGSAVDATIQQHLQSGTFQLDLTASSASFDPASATGGGSGGGGSGGGGGGGGGISLPLQPYQKLIVAHAVLCSLGFIVFLPAGALIARFLRVISPKWFRPHAYTQFYVAGTVILIGFILAIVGVNQAESGHFNDRHKLLGLIIVTCYFVQCSLGAFIHWVKNPNRQRRPPQNYLHAVFGLAIIALSIYQVHLGYDTEWPETTGRDDVPDGIGKVWLAWTIILALAYFGGLVLLRKQFAQEKAARNQKAAAGSAAPPSPTGSAYRYRALSGERGESQS